MDISFQRSRATAALGALLLLVAAVGGGFAAAPTVDTETTDTTSQSALTDGMVVENFDANASENLSTLQVGYDSTNPGIKIVDPDTGAVIKTVTNESDSDYFTETGSASGTTYYNTTFDESDFAAVPMGADENKTVTLRVINNTSMGADAWDTTNISITLDNVADRAVVTATSEADNFETETVEPNFVAELLGADDKTTSSVEQDDVAINGDNTTVTVVYLDDEAAAPYETAAANKSYGLLSLSTERGEYDEGDQIGDQIVSVEDTNYGVYSAVAPDDVLDATGATYATYETVDGHPAHEITLGDDFEDETKADISTNGNEKLSWTSIPYVGSSIKTYGSGTFGLMSVGALGAALLIVGRPKVNAEDE